MKRVRSALAGLRNALAGVMGKSTLEITVGPVKLNVFQTPPEPTAPPEPSELARRATRTP